MQFHALLQHHRKVRVHCDGTKRCDVTPRASIEFFTVYPAAGEDATGGGRTNYSCVIMTSENESEGDKEGVGW